MHNSVVIIIITSIIIFTRLLESYLTDYSETVRKSLGHGEKTEKIADVHEIKTVFCW